MSAFTTGVREGVAQVSTSFRNSPKAIRTFVKDPNAAVGGASVVPLLVLMGHTFIDALDSAGFVVILPEIQKTFDLELEQISSVGGLALLVSFVLGIPIAVKSEATTRRTLYLGAGAVVAAVFSVMSAVAMSLGLFLFARSGFGLGLRLNDPVQQSMLSDFYPVATRSTVFSARDGMTRAGRLVGPVFFGVVTAVFGWRAALFAVAIPSAALAYFSFRLHNPVRGAPEREAAGLPPIAEEKIVNPPTLRQAFRVLNKIRTVRRLWYSLPFLTGGLIVLAIMLPLYMEEEFGLEAAGRGFVSASGEAAAILGLLIATPVMTRYLTGGKPDTVYPFLSLLSIVVSVLLFLLALAPNTPALVAGVVSVNFAGAVLAPALAVLLSMLVPPKVRTISFATLALWVVPGLFMLPIATGVGDEHGLRWAIAMAAPMFLVGALILTTGRTHFVGDLQRAFQAMADEFATMHAEQGVATAEAGADTGVEVDPEPVLVDAAPARPRAVSPTTKTAAVKKVAPAKKAAAKKAAAKKAVAKKAVAKKSAARRGGR